MSESWSRYSLSCLGTLFTRAPHGGEETDCVRTQQNRGIKKGGHRGGTLSFLLAYPASLPAPTLLLPRSGSAGQLSPQEASPAADAGMNRRQCSHTDAGEKFPDCCGQRSQDQGGNEKKKIFIFDPCPFSVLCLVVPHLAAFAPVTLFLSDSLLKRLIMDECIARVPV